MLILKLHIHKYAAVANTYNAVLLLIVIIPLIIIFIVVVREYYTYYNAFGL